MAAAAARRRQNDRPATARAELADERQRLETSPDELPSMERRRAAMLAEAIEARKGGEQQMRCL